jgi:hypothetical protein
MMATEVTFKLTGLESVLAKIRALDAKLADKVFRKVVNKAGDEAVAAIRAAARDPSKGRRKRPKPRPSGTLAASVGKKQAKLSNGTFIWCGVGPRADRQGQHGWLVEHGHRAVTGGSVERLDKQGKAIAGSAPIQKRGRTYTYELAQGADSKSVRRRKALYKFLAGTKGPLTAAALRGPQMEARMRELVEAAGKARFTGKESSPLLEGAVKTKGIREKMHGRRGEGRVIGKVPPWPFMEPTFAVIAPGLVDRMIQDIRTLFDSAGT